MGEWMVRAFAPGRTEIAGNHMDHQGGRVVSAAVTQGVEVLARPNGTGCAKVRSEGYGSFSLNVDELEPRAGEEHTSAALVRGMAAGLRASGIAVPGFDMQVRTTLPPGGGLSSSAAFEMAVGRALELLSGARPMPPLQMAALGGRAEREFFGKPCGLQDQSASACGGIVLLDFANPAQPRATAIDFDFAAHGYAVALVDARCDHSAFVADFAKVVADMDAAAGFFGARRLGQVARRDYLGHMREVAGALGDVVALRGFHYYNELHLVDLRASALQAGDMDSFLEATRRSAVSSAQYLQNVAVPGSARQPAMLALALADCLLDGRGACRIHGGGFGGTVQAYVPLDMLEGFSAEVERALGAGACNVIAIRPQGADAGLLHP